MDESERISVRSHPCHPSIVDDLRLSSEISESESASFLQYRAFKRGALLRIYRSCYMLHYSLYQGDM